MKALPHTRSCFVCGESNPIGFNLRFETDGTIVSASFVPRKEHAGFREIVHGGLIATLLDEAMVWVCAVNTSRFAFCAELNVRFLNPLKPGESAHITAELTQNRKDRIFEARAALKSGDDDARIFATASGKYLPIKELDAAALAEDFVVSSSVIDGNFKFSRLP